MRELLFALVFCACGAATEDEPVAARCDAAPEGYRAQTAGEFVRVSRPLGGKFVGGATLRSEARVVEPSALPTVVDFGDVRVRVLEDLTLCMATPATAE